MATSRRALLPCILTMSVVLPSMAFLPFSRNLWDIMTSSDDPFHILDRTSQAFPKSFETISLACAEWKETSKAHIISPNVPGFSREEIKVEVLKGRVLMVSGERRAQEGSEEDAWHLMERAAGKFCRQFRMPVDADMEMIVARMEKGMLRITMAKAGEAKRPLKVVSILEEGN